MRGFVDRLADPSAEVREAAARDVLELATFESDADDAGAFAKVVLAHGDAFAALIADPAPAVRAMTCRALGELATLPAWGDEVPDGDALAHLAVRARPRICDAVRDPDALVRIAAITALGHIPWRTGGVTSPDALVVAGGLADPEPAVRAAGVRTLVAQLGGAAEPLLTPVVDDLAREVGSALIAALAPIGISVVVPVLLRRLREDGPAADPREVRSLHLLEVPPAEVRAIARPLLRVDLGLELRTGAARAVIEHVDASCRDALTALAALGDASSIPAIAALARLGSDAPIDVLARWFDAAAAPADSVEDGRLEAVLGGLVAVSSNERPAHTLLRVSAWATAASGRVDHLERLLVRLPAAVRPPYGIPARSPEPSPALLLHVLALFDHPSVHAAALPFARDLEPLPDRVVDERAHHYGQCSRETGLACLALGSSGVGAGIPVIQRVRDSLARLPIDNRIARVRHRADLGLALLDPDALEAFVEHDNGWPPRVFTFEEEMVLLGFAFRLLGRRLDARGAPLSVGSRGLVASIVRFIDAANFHEMQLAFRERHPAMSGSADWYFFLRDLFAEARALLAARLVAP